MTDYLLDADQKIPNWLIKVTFMTKIKTVSKSGIKSRYGIMEFSTSDVILGLRFFSLKRHSSW